MLSTVRYAANAKNVTPIRRTARVSRSWPAISPRSCQMTMVADSNSITESRPKPTRAIEAASSPAVSATAASATIQVMVAYSSRKPRRRRRLVSAGRMLIGNCLKESKSAVRGYQLGKQLLDAPVDVVADRPDGGQVQARGVGQVPVLVAFAGIDGAG